MRILARSRESLGRFRRAVAAPRDERVAIGHVQLRQLMSPRRVGLDLVSRGKCRQECLRFSNLKHLRRRRKAFERSREDGVGIHGASGRLIELGERQRRAQTPTSCALLLRYLERGLESFLCRSGISWIALEQEFASQKMREGQV